MEIRKIVTVVEETHKDGVKAVDKPTRKAAAVAVIKNPFAGQYVEDLTELMEVGEQLGELLSARAIQALGLASGEAHSYGKGAVVGEQGELEHAAAILHPRLGKPFREQLGGGKAIIPSAKKMGGMGTAIDVPVHYKDAAFVRTHYDAMEVRVPDAPHADEILVALVVTDSGRPHARIGGLQREEIKGEDGLR
ncbi:MAG: amino acid synthesis family protein [Bacillota bacterium]|nr:amino acid synthesis family protein [Bacillota bacterium]MDP4159299.1 amino acid synthesis family protein [Bacillota bacterium]